ncbi:MAG TPA: hypothetical protein VFO25_05460 [Candidatus Eremiobacteraceae bacterium]|nr:hypothetical protein [Candidatus Eremiobacteraceae bacterium]
MTWEALTAIASLVTTLVIAVTAIVAIVQIRHLRAANQLAAAMALMGELETLVDVRTFVATTLELKLKDPAFRESLSTNRFDRHEHLEIILGNYWEKFGILLRQGLLDRQLFLDWGAQGCLRDWRQLREVTALIRGPSPQVWRDFEYLAHMAAIHLDDLYRHPLKHPEWRESLDAVPETGAAD